MRFSTSKQVEALQQAAAELQGEYLCVEDHVRLTKLVEKLGQLVAEIQEAEMMRRLEQEQETISLR
jgi:hypothetical protein